MNDSYDELSEGIDLSDLKYIPKVEIKSPNQKPDSLVPLPNEFYESLSTKKHDKKRTIKTMSESESKKILTKKEHKIHNPTNEEDTINKRRMILLLQFYLLEFPDKLETFKRINLEKKSYEELVEIRKEVDFTISQRSTIKTGVQVISASIQALEFLLVNLTPINCSGLSEILCKDQETINDMKHICLKHCHLYSTEPENRLLYKILQTTMLLHNINGSVEVVKQNNDEVIANINREYADI